MRTTGSISVERAAKPMKNNVMIKTKKLAEERQRACSPPCWTKHAGFVPSQEDCHRKFS